MAVNVGIGDLAMIVEEEDNGDVDEAREVYQKLSALLVGAEIDSEWEEPESLNDDEWDGHLDQMGSIAYEELRRMARAFLGERSHLASVGAPGFFVPVRFLDPIRCDEEPGVPGNFLGSAPVLLEELDSLRAELGMAAVPERATRASDDVSTAWNVLYYVARDSVTYRSAIRLG